MYRSFSGNVAGRSLKRAGAGISSLLPATGLAFAPLMSTSNNLRGPCNQFLPPDGFLHQLQSAEFQDRRFD